MLKKGKFLIKILFFSAQNPEISSAYFFRFDRKSTPKSETEIQKTRKIFRFRNRNRNFGEALEISVSL